MKTLLLSITLCLAKLPGADMCIDTDAAHSLAHRVADRFMATDPLRGNYTVDLALEAMLIFAEVAGDEAMREQALDVLKRRGWLDGANIGYKGQPFCHLNYRAYRSSGSEAMRAPFITASRAYRADGARDGARGLVLHINKKWCPEGGVLIDSLQDYASRMVHTGTLTGECDFFTEAVEQYRLHRAVLRRPDSGLWHNGRGFLADRMQLSPGAWSRGHGWLIRGMADCLLELPRDSAAFAEMRRYLIEVCEALEPCQQADGMFPVLLHRPPADSYPDSSGTGMIAWHLAACLHAGIIEDIRWQRMALRAWRGLQAHVDADGVVHSVSPGPGPLVSEDDYLHGEGHSEDGRGHGVFAVIFAASGALLLDEVLRPSQD